VRRSIAKFFQPNSTLEGCRKMDPAKNRVMSRLAGVTMRSFALALLDIVNLPLCTNRLIPLT
jgi:hypothetical protein